MVKGINESLLSTLAACGDVNRNVLAPPTPAYTKAREQVYADCHNASRWRSRRRPGRITPSGLTACNSNLEDAANKNFVDPLYGKTYLPRKFKIAFAIPPVNDMDVFTN